MCPTQFQNNCTTRGVATNDGWQQRRQFNQKRNDLEAGRHMGAAEGGW